VLTFAASFAGEIGGDVFRVPLARYALSLEALKAKLAQLAEFIHRFDLLRAHNITFALSRARDSKTLTVTAADIEMLPPGVLDLPALLSDKALAATEVHHFIGSEGSGQALGAVLLVAGPRARSPDFARGSLFSRAGQALSATSSLAPALSEEAKWASRARHLTLLLSSLGRLSVATSSATDFETYTGELLQCSTQLPLQDLVIRDRLQR